MNAAEVLTPQPKLVRDDIEDRGHYEIVDGVRVELPESSEPQSRRRQRHA